MKWLEENLGIWVVRHRWWIIGVSLLIVLTAAYGMRFLSFDNDNRVFFSKENPQLQAYEAMENMYTRTDNIIFVIAPKNGNVFTKETLAAVEELTEASWQIPYSSRVNSITNFQNTRAENDELIVSNLVEEAVNLSEPEINYIRRIALAEPFLVNWLVSPTGHVTGINVNVIAPLKSMDEVPEMAIFARKMADEFRAKHPEIDLYLTGGVMFDNAFGEATRDDLMTLIPAMFIAILVIIGIALRSFSGILVTLTIILSSMITALGLVGWLQLPLNPASANAPTIILVLAVADSVHILATMIQQMRRGKGKREAITESLRINLQPVFLTSATTTIGFLSMNFSDSPPFRDLGNIVAFGVMAAFVYSVTVLPALVAVLPMRLSLKNRSMQETPLPLEAVAVNVIKKRNHFFWGMLIIIIILTAGMFQIELSDKWIEYFDDRYDIRVHSDFYRDNLAGFNIIEYSLKSGEADGINNPEYLKKVEEFAGWYREQPNVNYVNTVTNVIKRLNKNMHGDDESYYLVPEQRDLIAQYLLLYGISLPFGLDLNNQINVDKSETKFFVLLSDVTTSQLREMDRRAREWLKANAPEMLTYGSGLSVIWAHISERNIRSMLGASFIALVLISGLLIVALKSFKLGLLSLIPNLTPAFMAFGLWGMVKGQIGLALSIVVAMTLGIVVDDTVHFMSKYLRGRREQNMSPQDAVRYAFHTVGTAMWVTTVALVAGFLILSMSGYKMNADMGLLTAITISLALLLDFLFLPVLLMKVDGKE